MWTVVRDDLHSKVTYPTPDPDTTDGSPVTVTLWATRRAEVYDSVDEPVVGRAVLHVLSPWDHE